MQGLPGNARPGGVAAPHPDADEQQPVRTLVVGQHPGLLAAQPGVTWVSDINAPHDAVLFVDPPDEEHFTTFLQLTNNPNAVVIAVGRSLEQRSDLVLKRNELHSAAERISELLPLIQRIRAIPVLESGQDRAGLSALIYAHTRQTALHAEWQPECRQAVAYPQLHGTQDARGLLEALADRGLLTRRFFDRIHLCAHCGSSRIHAREVCLRCRSSHLEEQMLVHHYSCAYQAEQPMFQEDDGLVCPKCDKALRHYGVDYDKPGTLLHCEACDQRMAEADVAFICADCSKHTLGDDAPVRTWFHYDLTPDGARAAASATIGTRGDSRRNNRLVPVRDFLPVVDNSVQIALRCDRPLSLVIFEINSRSGSRYLPDRLRQLNEFAAQLICENLRRGDLVALLGQSVAACLPESSRTDTLNLLERLIPAVEAALHTDVQVTAQLIDRADVLSAVQKRLAQ